MDVLKNSRSGKSPVDVLLAPIFLVILAVATLYVLDFVK